MIRRRAPSPSAVDQTNGVQGAPRFDDFEMRLGDMLRGERATLGKSLLDVQRELRIRASYIAAIENCDLGAFDAPSFIAGYVRSYARYLGLDGDWVFRRFCDEAGLQAPQGTDPAGARPLPRPIDPAEALANPRPLFLPQPASFWSTVEPRAIGSILVMAVLACGLAYGGWSVLQEVQKVNLTPSDQPPPVIAALDPVQEVAAPPQDAPVDLPQPQGLDRIYRPQALDAPVLTPRDTPIASIDPELPEAARVAEAGPAAPDTMADAVAQAVAQAAAEGPQLPAEQGPVRTLASDAPRMELLAARPAWVRVTSADGTVILEKTMDAGERFALPSLEQPPVLRTGNSGAVYFAVGGRTYGPAAPGAQVVKNVELSPTAVSEKFALADPANDPELARLIAVASAEPSGPQTATP